MVSTSSLVIITGAIWTSPTGPDTVLVARVDAKGSVVACACSDRIGTDFRWCAAADGFFSTDDLALHRTMFPRAFTLALVMTLSVKGTLPRLFGWRAGLFEARGFRVCTSSTTSSQGEASHVTSLVL